MSAPLSGMVAIVTGGGGGIGGATAEVLAADGANVIITGRTQGTLEATAARIAPQAQAAGGSIAWKTCDSLVESDVAQIVADVSTQWGRLDIAVNVVGGGAAGGIGPILECTAEGLEGTMRVNVTSVFHLIKHVAPVMIDGGGGSIVAVSSMQATEVAPRFNLYCAAKAALEMMCKGAADELGRHDIRVNIVRPGLTRNSNDHHLSEIPDVVDAYMVQQPLQRRGESIDIAQAIRYFAGPESSWTTGTALPVDGGNSLRRFPDLDFHWARRAGG